MEVVLLASSILYLGGFMHKSIKTEICLACQSAYIIIFYLYRIILHASLRQ